MSPELFARIATDLLHTNHDVFQAMLRALNANVRKIETRLDGQVRIGGDSADRLLRPICSQTERKLISGGSDGVIERTVPRGSPMYNLQKAKEEIDLVAKHTGVLTEHVIAISERLQALETSIAAKLDEFKDLVRAIEGRFSDLQANIVGGEAHQFETSALSDLASKLALLHPAPAAATPTEQGGQSEHASEHGDHSEHGGHAEHPLQGDQDHEHQSYTQHGDNHGGDHHHG